MPAADKIDRRPTQCRNRLRDEGSAYPKSGCSSCGNGGLFGCPHESRPTPPPDPAMGIPMAALQPIKKAFWAYVAACRGHITTGGTEAERRFSDGEGKDAAEEAMFEKLAELTFNQVADIAGWLESVPQETDALTDAIVAARRDAGLYGSGYVRLDQDGTAKAIPPEDITVRRAVEIGT